MVWIFLGIMFFDNFAAGLAAGAVFIPVVVRKIKKREKEKKNEETEKQFLRALEIMTCSMVSGTNFENALKEVAYGEETENLEIVREGFRSIDKMVCLNCDISGAFQIYASKNESREIRCFAGALECITEGGGDVIALQRSSAEIIRRKYEMKEDIKNCIAEPKLNHRIMTAVPIVLILIMRVMAEEYIRYLYTGTGRIIMGLTLSAVIIAWLLGEKIGNVKI